MGPGPARERSPRLLHHLHLLWCSPPREPQWLGGAPSRRRRSALTGHRSAARTARAHPAGRRASIARRLATKIGRQRHRRRRGVSWLDSLGAERSLESRARGGISARSTRTGHERIQVMGNAPFARGRAGKRNGAALDSPRKHPVPVEGRRHRSGGAIRPRRPGPRPRRG